MQKPEFSTVLILGGSGTIGRAIATEFGRQGCFVGIHYHQNHLLAKDTASVIQQADGHTRLYQADVRNPSQIARLFQSFSHDFGSLHLLVWAIGVAPSKLLIKTTPEEWTHTLQTNLTGAFHALREAGPIFKRQQDGAVIFIGSHSGEQGTTGQAAYAASKAGLMGLMRTAAQEWGDWNIRVNAIFPGWHSSPLWETKIDSALAKHSHILNRAPSLNHVASSVYHLASSQDISGQIWNLDSRLF